jgi:hypothetical protein
MIDTGSTQKYRWLLLTLCFVSVSAFSAEKLVEKLPTDTRYDLRLTASEKAEFLSEMRNMLFSVQQILEGIGASDRNKIAEAAKLSGNRMARATPASVRAKMPQSFRDLGGPTHMMFEELAMRADSDEMDMLASDAGKLMKQCLACHAKFRVH